MLTSYMKYTIISKNKYVIFIKIEHEKNEKYCGFIEITGLHRKEHYLSKLTRTSNNNLERPSTLLTVRFESVAKFFSHPYEVSRVTTKSKRAYRYHQFIELFRMKYIVVYLLLKKKIKIC